ncbi:MAG: peptidoglycan editing factor PgeF [Proteobacteria bacterium]|nr:peptidoglycan editing factor PgeF [Pseudomonadota bacterium]
MTAGFLFPEWRIPGVRAAFSLRAGGVSIGPFASLNVGVHVGDSPAAVTRNRQRIRESLTLPADPAWLEQVHGTGVAVLNPADPDPPRPLAAADAVVTRRPRAVCAIQVADCLPVLLAARDGSAVGAAHAGWRGLAAGVIEAAVGALAVPQNDLVAWLGPCIGPGHFEVGGEVREAFLAHDPGADEAFVANARGRWQCDLPQLARRRLGRLGLRAISGGQWCTYADAARFFSYRRDGQCGRMAALIWME